MVLEECNNDLVALVLRGDHELNELKAEKIDIISKPLKFATEEGYKKNTQLQYRICWAFKSKYTNCYRSFSKKYHKLYLRCKC